MAKTFTVELIQKSFGFIKVQANNEEEAKTTAWDIFCENPETVIWEDEDVDIHNIIEEDI